MIMTEQMNQELVYCPLSGSSKIVLVEKIAVSDLSSLYQKALNCDVASEFGNIQEIDFYHSLESDLYFFSPMITGSENFYEKLQVFDWYYLEEKNEYDYAKQFIKPSDFVLEIGCGKGAFARKIHCQDYIGLEFSQKARDLAEKDGITVLNESIQDHALNNPQKYSVVCAFQVLEHISDIYTFIEASIECLKPGGILIYSVPSADSFISLLKNNILNMPPHHVSWWSEKTLQYIADLFKLNVINIHHEKLEDIHKRLYLSCLLSQAITNNLAFYDNKKLVDCSLTYKIISKISSLASKFLEKGFTDLKMLPNGHSITAVYQKTISSK